MSTFQWIESIGTIVTVCAAVGALGYFRALNIIVQAQLHPNGGGSLLDLVRLIPLLRKAVEELRQLVESNHAEGKEEWGGLHAEDKAIMNELTPLKQMAADLQVSLPDALGIQQGIVKDVANIINDVHSLTDDMRSMGERMDRVEAELFGD